MVLKQQSVLVLTAFQALFPNKDSSSYFFYLSYSKKFKPFNANVKYRGNVYMFMLSHEWKDVSSDITIGVIQDLLLKVFKNKLTPSSKYPLNVELYHSFLKKVHKYKPKETEDVFLKDLFDRMNDRFFSGLLEISNLKWGSYSTRTLGHYAYGSDTITLSKVFQNIPLDKIHLAEFVMYHEMLHKKHKFYVTDSGSSIHHSTAFRRDEALFGNIVSLNKELSLFARQCKKYAIREKKVSPMKSKKQHFFQNPFSFFSK